jgi:hypothetical protein
VNRLLRHLATLGHILGWFPQILKLGGSRYRTQVRLLALAGLVGIVAGLGAIVFYRRPESWGIMR